MSTISNDSDKSKYWTKKKLCALFVQNFQNQMEPPLIKTNNEYNNLHQDSRFKIL